MVVQSAETEGKTLIPLVTEPSERRAAYRLRRSEFEFKRIHPADLDSETEQGWTVDRRLKRRLIVKRPKKGARYLEDRVWCLMHNMGYGTLNGENFKIEFTRHDRSRGRKQIDVFAKDEETVAIIECKSCETRRRRRLAPDITETESLQRGLANAVREHFGAEFKPKVLWLYVTENVIWSEEDLARAEAANIRVVTENELQYFEAYIGHVGSAGRYQFLAEFLQGQVIPELSDIKVPATRGAFTFYAFTISARHLLKIAFVNHQALNHPDSRPAYQRMINKARLRRISEFIVGGGYFPTNVLVNFTEKCRFERLTGEEAGGEGTRFGWLYLPNKYKTAWIIDGQHRLFGFTDLSDDFLDVPLFVIAFEQMDTLKEADLFITINHEQKSVPKSLLVALQADLKLGSEDPREGLAAISSALVRSLSLDASGPFFRRFAVPGLPAAEGQNLTIPEAVKGLSRSTLLGKVTGKKSRVPGFLSAGTDAATQIRARKILNGYFGAIMDAAPERWAAGRSSHVSVNPGVRAHLLLISDVLKFQHSQGSIDPDLASVDNVVKSLTSFIAPYYDWLKKSTDEQVAEKFSRKFGEGGVIEYFYGLLDIVAPHHPGFGSEEYRLYKERQADERNVQADRDLNDLQSLISEVVVEKLKEIHGTHELPSGDRAFWELGIENFEIRQGAYRKQQQEPVSKRAPKEAYLDLIDFEKIIKQSSNREALGPIFSIPPQDVKVDKNRIYLDWLLELNELRRITAHKSVYRQFREEDYVFISWLKRELYERCTSAGYPV